MNSPQLVIVSDLDGTLLDRQTYSYEASLPTLRKLQALRIPLVFCSSKTRSEMEPLWHELELKDPFIVENGGAIFFLPDYFPFPIENAKVRGKFHILELGERLDVLRPALLEGAQNHHVSIRSFGEMTVQEISQLTGLPRKNAQAASEREYDEPFIVRQINYGRLFTALRTKGFRITQGDRFFHLSRGSDKGKATRKVLELYRRIHPAIRSVGLGDSGPDLPMLREVETPILIRKSDRSWDSTITQNLAGIKKTMKLGPAGWSEAVEQILSAPEA
ncbi:MAG TPA: HAD-IIB family hydrolase [Candidatus Udaeobacter sp.]|nr:HAD-IIB family hydrolase [Candidatus Udaeobacter sp.]